ncbi:MAG: hypothetical protein K0R54_1948 [Clostridiaceae bacterium]|jgi:predicted nucleic acid-binding protein|nr:hypothetical protein [Clostridiaceae bacterium]
MNEYLLDTNVVIGLWKQYPSVIDKLNDDKKIKILKEVSEELVVKEMKEYRGQHVLSDRFCKLLAFILEVDRKNIKEFYNMIDIKYSKKGNAYFDNINKLSDIDLLLLYACFLDGNLILVTEDKYLFNAANQILGNDRVMTLKMLVENE